MIGIISLIIAVLIPLIIWLRKSYLEGPELTIELKKSRTRSRPSGFSNKNIPVDGAIEMRDAIQLFELEWDIDFIIRNNSEHTAYYPKILFKEKQAPFLRIDKLNERESIASKAKVIISAVYQEYEEAKGNERNKMIGLPENIKGIQVLLEYKNSSKSAFYTHYYNTDETNHFSRKKPKGFS